MRPRSSAAFARIGSQRRPAASIAAPVAVAVSRDCRRPRNTPAMSAPGPGQRHRTRRPDAARRPQDHRPRSRQRPFPLHPYPLKHDKGLTTETRRAPRELIRDPLDAVTEHQGVDVDEQCKAMFGGARYDSACAVWIGASDSTAFSSRIKRSSTRMSMNPVPTFCPLYVHSTPRPDAEMGCPRL